MNRETVTSFDSEFGMTLGMLRQHIEELLSAGNVPESEVRVRTFFKANKHGAQIKKLTVIDK